MNGEERQALDSLLSAHLTPIKETQAKMEKRQIKHGEDISAMKTKLDGMGNCSGNEQRIKSVEKDVKVIFDKKFPTLSNRLWAIVIGVPALILTIVGIIAYMV